MPWGAAAAAVGVVGSAVISSRSADKAADRAAEGAEQSGAQIQAAADRAREDVFDFFPSAQKDLLAGAGAAGDIISGGVGEQQRLLSAGNVGAQGTLGAGFGQVQNALLGLPVDQHAFDAQPIELSQPLQNPLVPPKGMEIDPEKLSPEDREIFLSEVHRAILAGEVDVPGQGLFSDLSQLTPEGKETSIASDLLSTGTNIDVYNKIISGELNFPGVDPNWISKLVSEGNLSPNDPDDTIMKLAKGSDADIQAWRDASGFNEENKNKIVSIILGLRELGGIA